MSRVEIKDPRTGEITKVTKRYKDRITLHDCALAPYVRSEPSGCCGGTVAVYQCPLHGLVSRAACSSCSDWSPVPATPGRFKGRLIAITSLTPNPDRWNRQRRCLDSWNRAGLDVLIVNTAAELDMFNLPEYCQQVSSDRVTAIYDRPTLSINALIDAGILTGLPFLLINSDIQIAGNGDLLEGALQQTDRLGIGVRWNYAAGNRQSALREHSGLDAFLLSPELAATVPAAPFGIGKPVWDYWLPHHFRSVGIGFHWIDQPLFWHQKHDLGWNQKEWLLGRDYLASQYGNAPVYGSPAFREGLAAWEPHTKR